MIKINRENILLSLLILVAIAILSASIRIPFAEHVSVSIIKQKGNIRNIETPVNAEFTTNISVETLNFPQSSDILRHRDLGKLGYKKEFFIKAVTYMDVQKAGTYHFDVTSDDGFRLLIDDKKICEHKYNRGFLTTSCLVLLQQKLYKLELLYYQKNGPMGLNVQYRFKEDKRSYFVGESSNAISFKEQR